MIERLKHIILKDTTIIVVGIHFEKVKVYFNVLKLSNKQNNFTVVEKSTFDTFEALSEKLEKKYPILLAFSGSGIINKKIEKRIDYKSGILLNADINDFYFFEKHYDIWAYASVARKDKIDPFFQQFDDSHFLVVDYSIGPFVASLLFPFIEEDSITSHTIELHSSEEKLLDFSTTSNRKNIILEELVLSEKEVAMFATAINYLHPSDTIIYESTFLLDSRKEKKFKKYFELTGATVLATFFVLLFISYLALNHYNSKIIEANASLQSLQETYTIIKKLEKDRDNKNEILIESGMFASNFMSFYINELTVNIPETITLSEYLLFPYNKKVKKLEKIKFDEKSIIIKGESISNITFNDWYKGLKKAKWIDKLDIISYKTNKNNNYNFEIKISVN